MHKCWCFLRMFIPLVLHSKDCEFKDMVHCLAMEEWSGGTRASHAIEMLANEGNSRLCCSIVVSLIFAFYII